MLGIGKTTLYRKLKEYRLSMDDFEVANLRPAEITASDCGNVPF
jgi:hypothetical protein